MTLNIQNLDRLISFLQALPEEKFSMDRVFKNSDGSGSRASFNECGTAACIAGWTLVLIGEKEEGTQKAQNWIGIGKDNYVAMFMPAGYFRYPERFPLSRALRMLRHLRAEFVRTGTVVVDWDAPEAVETPRKAWAPPLVIGADKPLPKALTSLLRETAPSTSAEV